MKIVIPDGQTVTNGDLNLSVFEQYGEVVVYPLTSDEELVERLQDADAVLTNKCRLTADVLRQLPNLKYIGLFATGYNNIDTAYTDTHGITVCNAGSYSTQAVAQHTFALLLNAANRVEQYSTFVHGGGWKKSPTFSPFVFPMTELSGKTLGIIGFGSIGREVAKIAQAFSMNVLVYARHPGNEPGVSYVDLDTLTAQSDYITLHCPLNADSEGLFNAERFAKCKRGAYLINTARGAIVDEYALRDALENGTLSGAAIDVLGVEPMREGCPLLGVENCTVTPHVAWAPLETRIRLLGIVEANLRGWIEGKPQNVVSPKA